MFGVFFILLGFGYFGIYGYVNILILFGVSIVVWVDVFFLLYLFWCLMMLIFIGSCNELLLVIVLLKEY